MKENIYPDSLRVFEYGRGFLRQNLYPWSVLQCRTTDGPRDQTSQILAKLHRLGTKLFLNSYLHWAPADTIPLESLLEFKVLFPQRWLRCFYHYEVFSLPVNTRGFAEQEFTFIDAHVRFAAYSFFFLNWLSLCIYGRLFGLYRNFLMLHISIDNFSSIEVIESREGGV